MLEVMKESYIFADEGSLICHPGKSKIFLLKSRQNKIAYVSTPCSNRRVAPLVTNYKLPDQWQKVMVTKKLGDGTEKNTIFLYPPGCPKEQKLKNNDELIRYTEILTLFSMRVKR